MVDDFKKNKEGIEESLSFFDKKFRRYYKEGHLILACHAAFPVSVSVDLLYQLWANFKSYQSRNGSNEVIPLLAVSDLLLSSFFRQTSKDVYEMQQHARTYLLDKLTADPRFGELRIKELASFLFQYIKNQPDRPETRNFREAQKWAAILAVDPAAATQEILLSLKKKIDNSQVNSSIGIVNMIEDLVEGNPLFAEKMASHLQAQEIDPPKPVGSAEIQGEQKSIILSDKDWPGAIQLKINLPAHLSNRLKIIKTEQELKKAMIEPVVERIFAPMVGISEYQSQSMRLTGPVNDVKKLSHAILTNYGSQCRIHELLDSGATKRAVMDLLNQVFNDSGPNDLILFYFGGHAVNTEDNHRLIMYDYPPTLAKDESDDDYSITQKDFNELLRRNATRNPYVVLILDTHSGADGWIHRSNPKHIAIMASHVNEEVYELPEKGGLLTDALAQVIMQSGRNNTYRQLYQAVFFNVDLACLNMGKIQTTRFIIHPETREQIFLSEKRLAQGGDLQFNLQAAGYDYTQNDIGDIDTASAITRFLEDHGIENREKAYHYLQLKRQIQLIGIPRVMIIGKDVVDYARIFTKELYEVNCEVTHISMEDLEGERAGSNTEAIRKIIEAHVLIIGITNEVVNKPFDRSPFGKLLARGFAYDKDILLVIEDEISDINEYKKHYRILPSSLLPITKHEGLELAVEEIKAYAFLLNKITEINKKEPTNPKASIEAQIDTARTTNKLNLSELGLVEFPGEVIDLPNLENLGLSANRIREIPELISKLKNLKLLDLKSNPIRQLPQAILLLRKLESLHIEQTALESLPEEIDKLVNLRDLDFSGSQIAYLPEAINRIKNLNLVTAAKNKLLNLPADLLSDPTASISKIRSYFSGLKNLDIKQEVIMLLSCGPSKKLEMLNSIFHSEKRNDISLIMNKEVIDSVSLFKQIRKNAARNAFIYIDDGLGEINKSFENMTAGQLAPYFKALAPGKQVNIFYDGNFIDANKLKRPDQASELYKTVFRNSEINSLIVEFGNSLQNEIFLRSYFENYLEGKTISECFRIANTSLTDDINNQGSGYELSTAETPSFKDHSIKIKNPEPDTKVNTSLETLAKTKRLLRLKLDQMEIAVERNPDDKHIVEEKNRIEKELSRIEEKITAINPAKENSASKLKSKSSNITSSPAIKKSFATKKVPTTASTSIKKAAAKKASPKKSVKPNPRSAKKK